MIIYQVLYKKKYLIRIMRSNDYSSILDPVPMDIMELVSSIRAARVKDGFRKEAYRKEYDGIRTIAMLASVKYSNAIEDIISTDERIGELVLRGGRPLTHSEEEIAGYGEALNLIHTDPDAVRMDDRSVKLLHRMIHAGKAEDRGRYKDRDNAIVSIDRDGRARVVMHTVPHEYVDVAMKELFDSYLIADSEGLEPLLLIPCVILDYLCIHPFIDGNGRTSRLLTYQLLYSHGYDICRYISLDEHIAATRDRYYRALNDSSKDWMDGKNDYFPFIRYFLQMLMECYIDLDTRFAMKGSESMKKNERIERILEESLAPMSKRQMSMALPDVSIHTIDAVIKRMMAEGKVEKIGANRNARYIMKRP